VYIVYVCVRLVVGAADADVRLQQYCCCLLYQCLITDPSHYIQQLVHGVDGEPPLMCVILSYLVDHDCEWGSVSVKSSAVCALYWCTEVMMLVLVKSFFLLHKILAYAMMPVRLSICL